jgi:hypothetical protein
MHTTYVNALRNYKINGQLRPDCELRVEPEVDEGEASDPNVTSLQLFSRETGDPLAGQIVLDPTGVRELHAALTERLGELPV